LGESNLIELVVVSNGHKHFGIQSSGLGSARGNGWLWHSIDSCNSFAGLHALNVFARHKTRDADLCRCALAY